VRTLCARLAQENIKDDIGKIMKLLNEMKEKDSEMAIKVQTDSEGRMKSMLWCIGKNRADYNHFGDVVTFDTTYRTNLYNLPFGLFIVVNNHFQSIIFGGVLLTYEKTEDFAWAFSNFIQIMEGKEPILLKMCQNLNQTSSEKNSQNDHESQQKEKFGETTPPAVLRPTPSNPPGLIAATQSLQCRHVRAQHVPSMY